MTRVNGTKTEDARILLDTVEIISLNALLRDQSLIMSGNEGARKNAFVQRGESPLERLLSELE